LAARAALQAVDWAPAEMAVLAPNLSLLLTAAETGQSTRSSR